jgi:hypothetical protein
MRLLRTTPGIHTWSPTGPPYIRKSVMGGVERARRHQGRAAAGEAGDAEVMHALYEGQRVSSRLGRFHPHRQRC